MPPPRSTDQQKSASSDMMKTRSGQETQGKAPPGSGSPNFGSIDKPNKAKQLKLVQEPDDAVRVASSSPQPATVELSLRTLLEKMDKKIEERFQSLESKFC